MASSDNLINGNLVAAARVIYDHRQNLGLTIRRDHHGTHLWMLNLERLKELYGEQDYDYIKLFLSGLACSFGWLLPVDNRTYTHRHLADLIARHYDLSGDRATQTHYICDILSSMTKE